MYYFFSFPNINLFSQFDNHDFSSISQLNKNLLLNNVDYETLYNINNITENKNFEKKEDDSGIELYNMFNISSCHSTDSSKLHPFELFSKLITIL